MTSPEWQTVLNAPIGSVISFQWVNLLSDMENYYLFSRFHWTSNYDYCWGFMDDGSNYSSSLIHGPRIPIPPTAPIIMLRDVKVLHYQFTEWERQESKVRWYQCWERLNQPQRKPIEVYRYYHRPHIIIPEQTHPIPDHWLRGYRDQGIDMTSIYKPPGRPWWDWQVLDMIDKYGPYQFRREDIWRVDWTAVYRERYGEDPVKSLADPRNRFDRFMHRWLQKTQLYDHKRPIRILEWLLGRLGW